MTTTTEATVGKTYNDFVSEGPRGIYILSWNSGLGYIGLEHILRGE